MGSVVYQQLQKFFLNGELPPSDTQRKKIKRMAPSFIIKDNRLFYTGPSRQYMRLVVLTTEEKMSVLKECHNNPATGNHSGVRSTRNRVSAGFYWNTIISDVEEWVRSCDHCQMKDTIKTVPPPLHPTQVREPWEVLSLDFIGPLPETGRGNKYVLTMTDVYTKWVIAEPLKSKIAAEVSEVIITKMYTFGMIRNIITDQEKEFVNQVNDIIFSVLKINRAVSSVYHPQTNGHGKRTNQNIQRTLRKYVNSNLNDWDLHLAAVVYGINTGKQFLSDKKMNTELLCDQYSTRYTPYFLLFHRHPRLPAVMNACPMDEEFEVADSEEVMDQKGKEMAILNDHPYATLGRSG